MMVGRGQRAPTAVVAYGFVHPEGEGREGWWSFEPKAPFRGWYVLCWPLDVHAELRSIDFGGQEQLAMPTEAEALHLWPGSPHGFFSLHGVRLGATGDFRVLLSKMPVLASALPFSYPTLGKNERFALNVAGRLNAIVVVGEELLLPPVKA